MIFRIPFVISNVEKLKSRSKYFSSKFRHKKNSSLEKHFEEIDINLTREEYLGIIFMSFINLTFILFILFSVALMIFNVKFFYFISAGISLMLASFISFTQLAYPRVFVFQKEKLIEKNILFALDDILIQLNSGVPLFDILKNISNSNYGELSVEFKKIVKRIGSGESEVDVLTDIGQKNHSVFFKRTLWQISNGLNSGSDMSIIIKESINALNEEQMIQIQNYGNELNPLIMMYMLMSVIIPSLSVTFMTVLASMMGLEKNLTMGMFVGLFIFVLFFQIMFLGLIKSKRPSLL